MLAWNEIAVQTGLAVTQTNQEAIMRLAYVQAAVFDAVDAVDGGYQPYVGDLRAHGTTDVDAAVAAAAHRILVTQFPTQQSALDTSYAASLANIKDGPAKTRGIALGEQAAADVQQARAHDGFQANVPYTFGSGPGRVDPAHRQPRDHAGHPVGGQDDPLHHEHGGPVPPRTAAGADQRRLHRLLQRDQGLRLRDQRRPHHRRRPTSPCSGASAGPTPSTTAASATWSPPHNYTGSRPPERSP